MYQIKFFLAAFLLLLFTVLHAQLPALPTNMSNIRATDVTNEQLSQIVTYMQKNNVSEQQVYSNMIARGMQGNEASALRTRIHSALEDAGAPNNYNSNTGNNQRSSINRYTDSGQNTLIVNNPNKIFGLDIFNNGVLTFEPNLKIATPVGYILGPDDEIIINIYGYQEANLNLMVSPEGNINIPYVGVLYVAGLTIEQATTKIKNKLAASGYANIRTGLTKVNVTVGKIRSIHVTIIGEVRKQGGYTLPSLATAFNALYLSGGPNEIGSMRKIEIIRSGKVVSKLDIYDFLIKGDRNGDINLKDQDVIRIPPYDVRVALTGEVKRPGLFEILPGETFQNLLNFAGGFTDSAYTSAIKVYKVTDTEKRITDISKDKYNTYTPSRSEAYVVRRIINRFTNMVNIKGAVYLPGEYELIEGMTLADLIKKAQGLREDAFMQRGLIVRSNEDLTTQLLQFSPGAVVSGRGDNLPLKRNDEITISSVFDIKEAYTISINGEVRHPGEFTYTPNLTVKDVVLLAGGFTDAAAPQRIEIGRRIKKDSLGSNDLQIAQVIEFNSANDFNVASADIKLLPWDEIQVRSNPGYRKQIIVRAEGEVTYPGSYVIATRDERVSDLIKRSGGVTPQAYTHGAYITRINTSNAQKDVGIQKIQKIQKEVNDSSNEILEDVTAPTVKIALDIDRILKNPHSDEDITLQEGDVLNVAKQVFEVKINGEVLFPTQVVYKQGEDLMYYIDKAGGFTDDARKKRTYVLYGNGNASKTKRFLFIKNFPKVEPGAEILVPKISERKRDKLSTTEIVAITGGIASLVGVVVALLSFLKN